MVTTMLGCDSADQMAKSVLAAAADVAMPVAAADGLAVVVSSNNSAETELAAAEVATARSAAANLRKIEHELLTEIEEIIGRADSPQVGDEQALRELHAMLAKARGHVKGPLARAEERASQRLAAAHAVKTRKDDGGTRQESQCVATCARRVQLHTVGEAFRTWRSHRRYAARARRLINRWHGARVRTAFHALREATTLLAGQRKQESYRLALSELQARVAVQEESRSELLKRLAEVETDPMHLASPRTSVISQEHIVMAVTAEVGHSLDAELPTTPPLTEATSWRAQRYHSDADTIYDDVQDSAASPPPATALPPVASSFSEANGEDSIDSVVVSMIKLRGHRRQESGGIFVRPYLIYEYEVSVGSEIWQGEKRYTDFEALHNDVAEALGCTAVHVLEMRNMQLPPKRYVGNLTPEVGDERLLMLQHYLTQLGHLASPAAASSGELPRTIVRALHSVLVRFVRTQHQVVAADFVVAAANSYFERVEQLREEFNKRNTQGTGRLTEAEITRFLVERKFPCGENSDIAAELRELRGSGVINQLKQNLEADVSGSHDDGLTLVDVESWWSQRCLRTQSASAHG